MKKTDGESKEGSKNARPTTKTWDHKWKIKKGRWSIHRRRSEEDGLIPYRYSSCRENEGAVMGRTDAVTSRKRSLQPGGRWGVPQGGREFSKPLQQRWGHASEKYHRRGDQTSFRGLGLSARESRMSRRNSWRQEKKLFAA